MTIQLNKDFKELLVLFIEHHVKFVIVGAHAVALHGYPRTTGDLDLLIHPAPDNAQKVLDALSAFGFAGLGLTIQDFVSPDTVIQLGYPPFRIDLVTSIDAVDTTEALDTAEQVCIDGQLLPFLSRECLLRNKKAVARHKDMDDIEHLTE